MTRLLTALALALAVAAGAATVPARAAMMPARAVAASSSRATGLGTYAYNAGNGNKIYAYWTEHRHGAPWALLVPGGYWRYGVGDGPTMIAWAKHEQARGVAAFLVDYRTVYGGFGWAEEKGDVEHALGWVRRHYSTFGLNPKLGFMIGGSSGAAMSDVAALDDGHHLAGAMSLGGAADTYDCAFDPVQKNPKLAPAAKALHHNVMPWVDYRSWGDSRAKNHIVKWRPVPFLLIHSIYDHTINIKMSDDFARHLRAAHFSVVEKRLQSGVHVLGATAWPYEDSFMSARIAQIAAVG